MMGRSWLNWALFLALLLTTGLCFVVRKRNVAQPNYEFLPEAQMVHSAAYDSFSPNANFADNLTLRTPPIGTVPRGQMPLHYQPTLQDAQRAGEELRNPFSRDDIPHQERGRSVYESFCQVCHGPLGQGNGPVTQRGFPPPASLLADRANQMKDGQMFHVLTYGQINMPSMASQLSRDDRWSVILYVRLLQGPYAPSPATARLQQVSKLFSDNCAACHGIDGTGTNLRKVIPLIPDFTSLAWQMSQTELAIVNQIEFGSHPWMPGFRYKLPSEEILSLAVYVRSFAAHARASTSVGLPPTPESTVRTPPATSHISARSVYGTYCFACHDTNGKGNSTMRAAMPEIPDFAATTWQKSRTDADLAQSILQGKGKFMLPMKDKLGTLDVKQMVALVRGFEGGKQRVELEAPKAPGPAVPEIALKSSPESQPRLQPEIQPLPSPAANDVGEKIRVGATLFQQYCIVCHGPDGMGTVMRPSMPPIPDFTRTSFHQSRSNAQIEVSILDGKGTLMPANRGRVTVSQAQALVAFVRAFGPKGISIPSGGPVSDSEFDKSFKQLQEQWNELQKQMKKAKESK